MAGPFDHLIPENNNAGGGMFDHLIPEKKGVTGHLRDAGLQLLKGAISVPEMAVGLVDIPAGGRVGKFLENEGGLIGYRPQEAKDILSGLHTDHYKQQQQNFAEADGLMEKAKYAVQNPSLITGTLTESAFPMLAGGVAGRGIMAASAGQMARRTAAMSATEAAAVNARHAAVAAGMGEGAVMAGMQASELRSQTDDGLLTPTQSIAALGTGVVGGILGWGGGRLAQRLGIGDIDVMLAQGIGRREIAGEIASAPAKSIPRQIIEGAIAEGFLEELPQEVSEQVIQNLALGKPWHEGVEDAAVMGALAGMAMGGGAAGVQGYGRKRDRVQPQPTDDNPAPAPVDRPDPANGPLSKAASALPAARIDAGALERAGVTPPPVFDTGLIDAQLGEYKTASNPFTQGYVPQPEIRTGALEQAGVTPPPTWSQTQADAHGLQSVEEMQRERREHQQKLFGGKTPPASLHPEIMHQAGVTPDPVLDVDAIGIDIEPKAQRQRKPERLTPEENAAATWDSMNAFERGVAAKGSVASVSSVVGKSWSSLTDEQRTRLIGAVNKQQGSRWTDPNRRATDQSGPVLQPRDRSQQASISQMLNIANAPDYAKASYSRTFTDGAPVTIDEIPNLPAAQRGRQESVTTASDRKIPVQYAVVEAGQLLPSNNISGASNAEYSTGGQGKSRAIAGNGRVAGLTEAWKRGTAEQYKADMMADDAHGISPEVIQAMKRPVLVRLMPQSEVTDDIGDLSNRDGKLDTSVVEQAKEDGRSIDLASLAYDAEGGIGGDTVKDFVSRLPGASNLVSDGKVTQEARDRLAAAVFQKAYNNDALTELLTERGEGARSVINAMALAAPHMTRLEGAGVFDIRGLVAQAGEIALTAAREGRSLQSHIQQLDMGVDPHVYPILEMMVNDKGNIRSAKYIAEQLTNLANLAYYEASQPGTDMFGERQTRTTQQLINDAFEGVTGNVQQAEQAAADGEQPGSGEDLRQPTGPEPAAQVDERPESGRERPADTRQAAPAQPEAEQGQPAAVESNAPETWRTNYIRAAKVARDLGIDPKQHKKLADLVAAIDAFNAEPVASQPQQQAKERAKPALELNQQTEESLAKDAERLEQLQKEEAKQKAAQKAAESKQRERDADKSRADEVVDDFQLGQSAEQAMSGMGDIFDTSPSAGNPGPDASAEPKGQGEKRAKGRSVPVGGDTKQSTEGQADLSGEKAAQSSAQEAQQSAEEPVAKTLEEAVIRQLKKASKDIRDKSTGGGRRKPDTRWEQGAIKRFIRDGLVKTYLSGKQTGPLATAKIGISKAESLDDIQKVIDKLEAAAAEVGATLPTEVTRALQADMEGRVADVAQPSEQGSPRFSRKGNTDTAEGQRQFKETERAYGGRDAYDRAKKAGKTKLNYQQWVQVRTPAFKEWFGDWETASSGPERKASNFTEARQAAKAFQRTPLTNHGTGIVATVSRNNLDKMLSQKAVGKSASPELHSAAVANLDSMFERAVLGWSKPDSEGDPNIKAIHRFFTPVLIDGKAMMAKMTLKETVQDARPNPLYTVEAVSFEELKNPAAQWVGEIAEADGIDPRTTRSAGLVESMAQNVQQFNTANVSKVTDPETGEPMVVYHGTTGDFDSFDNKKTGANDRGLWGKGHYFASNPEVANSYALRQGYGANVVPAFVSIRNPLTLKTGTDLVTRLPDGTNHRDLLGQNLDGSKIKGIAESGGHDGVIQIKPDGLIGDLVAYDGGQIKSATGNVGTFRKDTGNINFSFAGQKSGTAMHAELAKAKRLAARGVGNEDVRQATGWHRGTDGKWRYEISDHEAKLAVSGSTMGEVVDLATMNALADGRSEATIGDVMDHPALFRAYPELAKIKVRKMGGPSRTAIASVRAVGNTFTISLNPRVKGNYALSALIHELQHAIQTIEGFARGGNSRMAARLSNLSLSDKAAANAYMRLYGEVEARNTQARMQMNEEFRKLFQPSETQDVSDADAIVTFNGSEVQDFAAADAITEAQLRNVFAARFPKLVKALDGMLAKGDRRESGGLIILSTADPLKIAGQFSKATGRDLNESIRLFSNAEDAQGFFDPRSGLTFLVGPSVNETNAAAVVLHEAIHGQQNKRLDQAAVQMLVNRKQEKNADTRAFLDRVVRRMAQAEGGVTEPEAAAYIVEQAIMEGRGGTGKQAIDSGFYSWLERNLGQAVADLVRGFVRAYRQFALRNGLDARLTIDDMIQYAQASMKQSARAGAGTYGSAGIRHSFAGQRSATADQHALGSARQRIEAGENPETVRQETGWHQGADGKWRYEISDHDAKLRKPFPSKGQLWGGVYESVNQSKVQRGEGYGISLGEILDHPALFAAYPGLADLSVSTQKGSGASYESGSPSSPASISIGTDVPMYDVASELLHEIQHGIQNIEGFARGGSIDRMREYSIEHGRKIVEAEYGDLPSYKKAKEEGRLDAWVMTAMQASGKGISPYEAYRRLAGEVEARNTQARQRMTDAERRATAPSETADVAGSDVIVVYNGTEMHSAPMPANADAGDIRYSRRRGKRIDNPNQLDLFSQLEEISNDDPYQKTKQRAGTTEKQRGLGRSALRDLFGWLKLRHVQERGNKHEGSTGGVSLLGATIYKDFHAGKPYQLVGQKIESPKDLAALAQVYRDPRFETFRAFYLDSKGKIILEQAASTRMPASVAFTNSFLPDLHSTFDNVKASSIYILHNHPSGVPTPSAPDINITQLIGREFGDKLAGHVVINHNSYAVIDRNGLTEEFTDESLAGIDFNSRPEKPHSALNQTITSPSHIGLIAKQSAHSDTPLVVVTKGGASGKVGLIATIPMKMLEQVKTNRLGFTAAVRRMIRAAGTGGKVFIVLPKSYGTASTGYTFKRGGMQWLHEFAQDVVDSDGNSVIDIQDSVSIDDYAGVRMKDGKRDGDKRAAMREEGGDYQSDIRFSRKAAQKAVDSLMGWAGKVDTHTNRKRAMPKGLSQEQQAAAGKFDTFTARTPLADVIQKVAGWNGKRFHQKVFDQFATIGDYSHKAFMQAHLSKGSETTVETVVKHGTPYLKDGAIAIDTSKGGFLAALQKHLGSADETNRFFMYVAGKRSEELANEYTVFVNDKAVKTLKSQQEADRHASQLQAGGAGKVKVKHTSRENLFSSDDIAALTKLNAGKLDNGKSRPMAYAAMHQELLRYQKAMLDMAEKAGIVNADSRKDWESEFYVPFYRVMENEDGSVNHHLGASDTGLMRQEVIKRLKGGSENLGDPINNLIANWEQLLSSSMKNMAANEALRQAEQIGAARSIPAEEWAQYKRQHGKEADGTLWTLDNGQRVYWEVADKDLLESLTALNFQGYNNGLMRAAGAFKRLLTMGVTISPTFRIRSATRDILHALAVADVGYNPARNAIEGWKQTGKDSEMMVQMLAGGGAIRFGSFTDGKSGDMTRKMIEQGIKGDQILNTPEKFKRFFGKAFTGYMELGDRLENNSRVAAYQRAMEKTGDHLVASFEARDIMNFTSMGSSAAVRALAQVLPFFNARLQGMSKLYRGAKNDPRRFWGVVGTIGAASALLYLLNADDDEYKALPNHVRDTYWPVKVGGKWVYIPKPFEVGSMASVIERFTELAVAGDDYQARDFRDTIFSILVNQLKMNPVPQIILPAAETWYNYDMFRGQAIDSMAMERLMPGDRYDANTSAGAVAVGRMLNVSPKKLEHMVNGYFGWLGLQALNISDLLGRSMMDLPASTKRDMSQANNWFIVGDFVKEPGSGSSKYSARFYDVQRDINQIYATANYARSVGDLERYQELLSDPKMTARPMFQGATKRINQINQQIRATIADRNLTAAEKTERLKTLYQVREGIARQVDERARAKG